MNAKPKILIVDDKPENLKALRKVLKDLDIELVEATSGNDALKATLRHDFVLALLDIQMPGMDGYELAGILREEEKTAHLPFIFISAVYKDNLNVFKGYENGAFSFITKPFQPEILINKVKFFIEKHQQEVALFELNEELERKVKQISEYKYALDESSIVAITDEKGIIKEVNNNFCNISKYSREELIGQDHLLMNSGYHTKEFMQDLWVTISSGKIWRGEVKNIAKDGTFYWLDSTIVPFLNDGGIPYQYMAIRSDITLRKDAEEKLLSITEELNKAQEIANSGSFVRNFITDIDTWSKNFYKILEFNKEEVIPSFETFLSRVHPDDQHIVEETLTTIEIERKMIEMEVRAIMPNGSVKWVSTNILPVFDGDNMIGMKGVMLDITERKHTQDQLLAVNNELEAFSYSVSHDLRAPLRAVNGYAQILKEDYGSKLDDEGKGIIETINYNAIKMGTLIDDLLALSKLGRKEVRKKEIDINELIEGVLFDLNKSVKHSAEIKIGNLHKVTADYGLMHQVMFNLISNAVKYSSKKENPVVEIFSEENNGEIIFSVKDNGAGFDMQYADKLFGVFQRLHSQEDFDGTGVGLAIVQRIIAKHGGKVSADGKVNEGAIFNFSLPIN